jgi:hypothetical protein
MKSVLAAAFLTVLALGSTLASASTASPESAVAITPLQPVWLSSPATGTCDTTCFLAGQGFRHVYQQTTYFTCCGDDTYNPCPSGWTKSVMNFTSASGQPLVCN